MIISYASLSYVILLYVKTLLIVDVDKRCAGCAARNYLFKIPTPKCLQVYTHSAKVEPNGVIKQTNVNVPGIISRLF
jgi:hypothetical protein